MAAAIATSDILQPGKITLPTRAGKPPVCINLIPSPRPSRLQSLAAPLRQ
jgi:hypothetical protein